MQEEILEIEEKVEELLFNYRFCIFIEDEKRKLGDLKGWKSELLTMQEESCRLKQRAIWSSQGDNNTKTFHKYA